MSTVTAVLEPQADGTVHVPVPDELRDSKLQVVATLIPVSPAPEAEARLRGFGALKGKIRIAEDFDAPLEDFKEYME